MGNLQYPKLSETLKNLRLDRGYTQGELAEEFKKRYGVNLSKSIISLWESGKANPSFGSLSLHTQFFKVSLDYLKGYSDYQHYENNKSNYNISTYRLSQLQELELSMILACNKALFLNHNNGISEDFEKDLEDNLKRLYIQLLIEKGVLDD